jgi:hypothetical protein
MCPFKLSNSSLKNCIWTYGSVLKQTVLYTVLQLIVLPLGMSVLQVTVLPLELNVSILRQPCAASGRVCPTAACAAAGLVCYTKGNAASRHASPTSVYSTADCATSESICLTAACAAAGLVSVLSQPVLSLDGPGLQKHVLPLDVSVLQQPVLLLNLYV